MKYQVVVEASGSQLPAVTVDQTSPETAAEFAVQEAAFAAHGSLKTRYRYRAVSVKHRGVELLKDSRSVARRMSRDQ